uniref:Trafficking protein particle complex subunit 10 n=1 Tax=Callorhinchus milii TaxID=7868 RepID=A0A4W3JL46_CALMI
SLVLSPSLVLSRVSQPLLFCSGAGDQTLFSSVYHILVQQLPREPMEWRRSYGRPPKMIHLEANFVQFKEELIPKEGNQALLTFPFLHVYWTDCCDTEVYKASTKDDITKWQNVLKSYSSSDWLIVVVESDTKKKNKTNILPRTSIVDKIRNDFCNKQSDRCVVLSDPLKDSARAQESWNGFFSKLRTLLLLSFTKNLGKFEDDMRSLREKRTEPGWSFCQYFMVQEELAFVFEMLQQYEDALVQYDELDALFTQYVLNYGAGEGATWLACFCQPVRSWKGLVLRKPIDMEKRELIQRNQATLLGLRSYLFSRQCTLLLFLQRPWQVAQRALELLHNCIQELKLLEVSVPLGALDCWVFLSCLEVLQRIEGCCDRAQLESNSSHTVGLWTYATEKLKALGFLCGLISEEGPNSEDLNRTVDLLAGLGAEQAETANSPQSPYKKLSEALSSVEAFEKHYLDLSHAAIDMYRNIGRFRSAQLLGKDLADYYMRKGAPQQAERYLQEALKTYVAEGWALPVAHTRKQLADCQKRLNQTENYLQTSTLLASDQHLTETERQHYCQEILTFASSPTPADCAGSLVPGLLSLGMAAMARLSRLSLSPGSGLVPAGSELNLELTIHSLMPMSVPVDHFTIHMHLCPAKESMRRSAGRGLGGTVLFPSEPSHGPSLSARSAPPIIELYEFHDKQISDNSLNATGIVCKNLHLLARRQDSGSPGPPGQSLEEGAHTLRAGSLLLQPGLNTINFNSQVKDVGTYTLRQLSVAVGRIQFSLSHIYPIVQYHVYSQEPQLTVEPLSDELLAGIPQRLKFTIVTGHYTVKSGDSLHLSSADSLPILQSAQNTASLLTHTRERVCEAAVSVQSSGRITSISLPPAPAYHIIEFELLAVISLPPAPAYHIIEFELLAVCHVPPELGTPTHAQDRASYLPPAMSCVEQKMSIDCPWSNYSTLNALTFNIPFSTSHLLLSAGKRKYVQVRVQNLSEVAFILFDASLVEVEASDSSVVFLQHIFSKQCLFFLWEVRWNAELPCSLQYQFNVAFTTLSAEEPGSPSPFTYNFSLENISVSTLYDVKAEIFPPLGAEMCKMGTLCKLEVSIVRLLELADVDQDEALTEVDGYCTTKLLYEVVDNSSNWAVCGKSSGVISMPVAIRATHKVHMEVMPLFAGNLPFPDVKLFKYLPSQSTQAGLVDTDSWMENDSVSLDRAVDELESSSLRSRGSTLSSASGTEHRGLPMPRLLPFSAGQVFRSSAAMQILVLPSEDDHVLEVSVT